MYVETDWKGMKAEVSTSCETDGAPDQLWRLLTARD
jgi:hypothetical protein